MEKKKNILNSEEIQAMSTNFAERLEKEEKSCEVYETLLQSYGLAKGEIETNTYDGETFTECKLSTGKDELKSEDYPDYYGGSYVGDDGKLVIYVVGNLDECQVEIGKIIENNDDYVLKQGLYSYKELLELKEQFDELELTKEQKEIFANITAYGPNDMDNLLMVEMNILDKEHISKFKQLISDSEMIVFKQGHFSEPAVTIRSGQGVFNSQNGRSTVTTRARRNPGGGPMGFIMSGHGTRSLGEPIRNGSANNATRLGTVQMRHWAGNTDAAFCQTSGVSLSNQFAQSGMGSVTLGPHITNAPVNTSTFFAGVASGIRSGSVFAVNQTITVGTVRMTGLSRSRFQVQPGDSGGPVYRVVSGQRPIVGNIISRNNVTGEGSFGLISPILNRFNLRLTW